MAATYMLRKHLRAMELANKPEAIAERSASRSANERALADCREKYPNLKPENFEEADAYRKERVAHYMEGRTNG